MILFSKKISALQANCSKNRPKNGVFGARYGNFSQKNACLRPPPSNLVILAPKAPLENFEPKRDVVKLYQRGTLGEFWQPELSPPLPLTTLLNTSELDNTNIVKLVMTHYQLASPPSILCGSPVRTVHRTRESPTRNKASKNTNNKTFFMIQI